MKIKYKNITDEKIQTCFERVMIRYSPLHDFEVTLIQKKVKSSTMQAQPVIGLKNMVTGVKTYKIKLGVYVRDTNNLLVSELPEEVLTGWFAHELGHIVDYVPYTSFGMIGYGFKYLFSETFKTEAEHAADRIAIEYGFHQEILATKKYILEHEELNDKYKDKIKKYYMSSEDVVLCMEDKKTLTPIPKE